MSDINHLHDRCIPEPNSGCWLWLGAIGAGGYGVAGKPRMRLPRAAHRRSWHLFHGPIPDGMHVLHKCDVRSCVNPEHLFLGTHQDNMADRDKKGRQAKGERVFVPVKNGYRNGRAKVSSEDIEAIRVAEGSQVSIGRRFGLSQPQVSKIKLRQSWGE